MALLLLQLTGVRLVDSGRRSQSSRASVRPTAVGFWATFRCVKPPTSSLTVWRCLAKRHLHMPAALASTATRIIFLTAMRWIASSVLRSMRKRSCRTYQSSGTAYALFPLPSGNFTKGERYRTIATIFWTLPDRSYRQDCYRAFRDGGDAIMSTHIREMSGLFSERFGAHERMPLAALLTLLGLLCSFPAAAQEADGARLFQQRCATCHSVEAGQNKTGPHLSGVVGRRAAAVEGATYSDALRSSGITWDSQSLDTFLTAPGRMVRGTRMTVAIPNAGQRAAIIQYLESQSAN